MKGQYKELEARMTKTTEVLQHEFAILSLRRVI